MYKASAGVLLPTSIIGSLPRPFAEAREPGSFESGDVDEHILPTTIAGDEAEALPRR